MGLIALEVLGIAGIIVVSRLAHRRSIIPHIAFLTVVYAAVMFLDCLYYSTIMSFWQLLSGISFLLLGPFLLIYSVIPLTKRIISRSLKWQASLVCISAILIVSAWTFGGWGIHQFLEPALFSLVENQNELLAKEFMQNNPPGQSMAVRGFRFPYFPLHWARGVHQDGVFYIILPSGPGEKASLIFAANGKLPSESAHHIIGNWYYQPGYH